MKTKIVKIRSTATDSASGLTGMVTHMTIANTGGRQYHIQPKGLSPKDKQPVKGIWASEQMLKGAEFEEMELPTDVIGSIVTDTASGFTGMAVAITVHTDGCVHVSIQPKGTIAETGEPIAERDFNILRLKGEKIPKLTPTEKVVERQRRPSPAGVLARRPLG